MEIQTTNLISPHGGELRELLVPSEHRALLREEALRLASITLTERQLCDIELLMNGAFSPLQGFMVRADYDRVVSDMRLSDGTLWPIPITLDVSDDLAATLKADQRVALRDQTGLLLAVMTIEDVWRPDKQTEAVGVFGTEDTDHPAVGYLMDQASASYVGGPVEGIQLPHHYDFQEVRRSPRELRSLFESKGWNRVVAFQTRNPMHRAHKELTDRAAEEVGGHLLIHPVVGMTKPGDIDYYTRVRCYRKLLDYYPDGRATMSLLPLAMRMGGPREAVWHAIIRKNYGCTHLIVGRDHAGPGKDRQGKPFYGPYDAQEMIIRHADEIGIGVLDFKLMVYVPDEDVYKPIDEVKEDERILEISGTELRRRLQQGEEIPSWFSYPGVVEELRKSHPPRHQQGFTVFFTGLSGSGKSTIANALMSRLLAETSRPITMLDGDVVRTHLSKGLGFSAEDRSTNIRRIGYVASEITKHRGIAICAPIAPYEADRRYNRELVSAYGGYVEVYADTPIDVCEQRDVKGLYAKARAGILKGFTGIDDPYEPPQNPEVRCLTAEEDVEACVEKVLEVLQQLGYLPSIAQGANGQA